MATIKAIEARSVHQIQSGQVIVDLCSVVKELVENSIDAGATNIEVRFKNQGLDSIEVQDNGSGIAKENYDTLALKHYTSKLSTYADLGSLQTFGFRGEALSSLCALSKFTVTTCLASDTPKGSKLEFEASGKLRGTSVVATQRGTTVAVEGLFQNLPVRRRELERNVKREWNRVLSVLNQYACIQTGLKFSVSQQPNKGKRMVLFSTRGNKTTRENIANVFGAKTLSVLIPLDLQLELEPTTVPSQLRINGTQNDDNAKQIRVKGHVSRPAHGEGRQTPDRQMFFVNGRPCGLPQFAKVFNDVYKSYNSSQSPFIFADIQLDTHLYDVNVSPDKRTILLHDQTRMLDNLRESLSTLFESQDYAMPTSQIQGPKHPPFKQPSLIRQNTSASETSSKDSNLPVDESGRNTVLVTSEPVESETADGDQEERRVQVGRVRVPPETPACAGQGLNLISRWIERKSEVREGRASESPQPTGDKQPKVARTPENAALRGSHDPLSRKDQIDGEETAPSKPSSPEPPPQESEELPDTVAGFRARLNELSQPEADRPGKDAQRVQLEPQIPSISAPSRVPDMRPSKYASSNPLKRAAPEVATITIGDQTVTSIIGSPSKKQRLAGTQTRRSASQHNTKKPAPVPSFNGRLTQMFAAQASSRESGSREIEVTTEMQDVSDQSDSSSENLFVGDDEEEEEENKGEEGVDAVEGLEAQTQEHENGLVEEDENSQGQSPRLKIDNGAMRKSSPSPARPVSIEENGEDRTSEKGDEVSGIVEEVRAASEDASEETQKRTQSFVKGTTRKKDATSHLQQTLRIDGKRLRGTSTQHYGSRSQATTQASTKLAPDKLDADDAEDKLSLTISKSDFSNMKIIGQFNLGFIIASRAAQAEHADESRDRDDELFIIDQHATDEKYNFERLQAGTVVQSQRLVQPKTLELTALEEDVVQENLDALEANGFKVSFDQSGDQPVGSRCQLLSLPLSRETTFSLVDLEELISLLTEHSSLSATTIPRPSKVRKMFAMRACRSSVMIGKSLSVKQMEKLVRHMGELDKPWNCPHGRPTMRHLCGLGAWDEAGWQEGDGFDGERPSPTDWAAYARGQDASE
ncbi:DNA mismatch repair protein MutL [Xylariomycetidae sp. FL0641]|nr:DNA mismatch repair protein MutL [Xylariomycetidae sp. FL0641]